LALLQAEASVLVSEFANAPNVRWRSFFQHETQLVYTRYFIAPYFQIWMDRRYHVAFYLSIQKYKNFSFDKQNS